MLSALNSLKGSTPSMDRISYSMIKNSPPSFKIRILNHYNNILNTHIPQAYKVSLVLPILKPQKPQIEPKSYRPISLNPCIAKILDKIIAKRLWWFVLTNKLIHNNQFGFKRGKSVLDSLLYVDHLATRSLSLKRHLSIISLNNSTTPRMAARTPNHKLRLELHEK